ncbi:glycosyltransferase family 4 protein [Flavobacterium sp. 123]|uniref:glycosyltransferase family 4 protein n=1 Tax=Flavobacterium sp. 123 TaxID=2135627 RepID=UPI000EB36A9E|nr:glycosyltransferase family 4 protein [Flavobacterium sp. 123]RKS98784.1 glycosyltransferase involved in cell wall biosynthesis [Flavobacterium sp. 123]
MKLLYIVPSINDAGGVARVLSTKTNYLIEKWGYEIHILTQNKGNSSLFYFFNPKIVLHDMILDGNKMNYLLNYKNELQKHCKQINPDVIIVADNGLKAYLVPFFLDKKTPLVFESHGSKFIAEQKQSEHVWSKLKMKFKLFIKEFGAKKYTHFVALSDESLKEWRITNGVVITNPLYDFPKKLSDQSSKKVIAVGRHAYEKGFDNLLKIWKKVVEDYPDWVLEIYGKSDEKFELKELAENLNLTENIVFHEPVQNINEKYSEASFYLMTSRFEGFGMVLIEAMAAGLPCVAYDCPCGPRNIIDSEKNGFLIQNNNDKDYINAVKTLIEDKELRIRMGETAKSVISEYNLDEIMQSWNQFFREIKNN